MFPNPYEEGRKQAEALLNSGLYELAEESRTGYVYGDHPFDRIDSPDTLNRRADKLSNCSHFNCYFHMAHVEERKMSISEL